MKDSGVQSPICWHPEIKPPNNKLFSIVLPPGEGSDLDKLKTVCPSKSYNVCCQNIKLGDNVSAKNVNIKQDCSLPELNNSNTITTFDGYALSVPWLAPPFVPDSKCKDTPRPTGVVCTEPDPYMNFGDFLEEQITFDADEVKSILNENWVKKIEEEQKFLDELAASIVAQTKAEKEREPTSPPRKKSWFEMFIDWLRKIFGFGEKKTVEELQEESDKKLEEVEEFTDVNVNDDIHITNTHVIIIIFICLLILYVIYKFLSNRSVQQGVGMGVGMGVGEEIYDNRHNIKNAASGLFEQAKNIGARVGEEIYDNRHNIRNAASGLFEQAKNIGARVGEEIYDNRHNIKNAASRFIEKSL